MTTTTHTSTPDPTEAHALIAVTKTTGLDGHLPGRDVIRAQIRELSGYLKALRDTISTRDRDPVDRQLRRDASALLLHPPAPDMPTPRQAEHLRQLARITGRFLDIAATRTDAS